MASTCETLRFGTHEIRAVRDGGAWRMSAIDVVAALEVTANPSRYWSDAKRRWREKSAPSPEATVLADVVAYDLPAAGGARRATDTLGAAALREMLPLLRSPRAESFARWLVGAEAHGGCPIAATRQDEQHDEPFPVLPLTGSAFAPGGAEAAADAIADADLRAIAHAELHFYRGQAQECADAARHYLASANASLRLSACMLSAYASLTLGDAATAHAALAGISGQLATGPKAETRGTGRGDDRLRAACVLSAYIGTVLLHLPSNDLPPLQDCVPCLDGGLRALAAYVLAHHAYLEGDYERGLGLAQGAMMASGDAYPIPSIYLRCVASMCQISLRQAEQAEETLMGAWNLARPDGLVEAFIEHHGPLQGLVEHCAKQSDPEIYRAICDRVVAFSRGWMQVHNPQAQATVTDKLSPLEFSIAMLACRDWTNRQIGDYLGLSASTVKHHLSGIMSALGVERRDQLKAFVLR